MATLLQGLGNSQAITNTIQGMYDIKQKALQEKQSEQAIQSNDLNLVQQKAQVAEMQRKEEWMNKSSDATLNPMLSHLSPEDKQKEVDNWVKLGFANVNSIGTPIQTNRQQELMKQYYSSNADAVAGYAKSKMESFKVQLGGLQEKLAKSQEKNAKPEEIQMLQKQIEDTTDTLNAYAGNVEPAIQQAKINASLNDFEQKNPQAWAEINKNPYTASIVDAAKNGVQGAYGEFLKMAGEAMKTPKNLGDLPTFEAETGWSSDQRGTTGYQDAITAWRDKKKSTTGVAADARAMDIEKRMNLKQNISDEDSAWLTSYKDIKSFVALNRIPGYTSVSDLPPDVVLNRKKGTLEKFNPKTNKMEPYKPEGEVSVGESAAIYKADKESLTNIVKSKDSIGAFVTGVNDSFKLLDTLSGDFNRGTIPGINKLSQVLSYQGGDPRIKPFKNALVTAMTDYMKVVTAGTTMTATELSIAAQNRAQSLLESSDNIQTFKDSLSLMKKEMIIAKNKMESQEIEIKKRLNPGKPSSTKETKTITKTGTYNGKKVIQYSDGSIEYAE